MPKSEKPAGGSDPARSKVQPPRERYVSKPLSDEERAELLQLTAREAASYVNPDPQSGFDLVIRVFSATIDDGEIRCMVKIEGQVLRPGIEAHAKGVMQEIKVPAIIVTEGIE